MSAQPEPFTLRVPDTDVADLRERLARTRFPDQAPGEPWAYGTDVGYLRQLAEYWRSVADISIKCKNPAQSPASPAPPSFPNLNY